MKSQLFDIRREYKKGRLTPGNLNDNPFEQFDHWLNDAIHSDEYEPTAMTVATVSTDGHPSTRTVLLKGVENGRFIFFTNYESRKGRQLTANPYISLSFVWHKLERQIHIEGKAERCAPADSDAYFASRPYKSKIGARISPQSHVIGSRMEIMRAFVPTTGEVLPSPLSVLNSGKDGKAGYTTVSSIPNKRMAAGKRRGWLPKYGQGNTSHHK